MIDEFLTEKQKENFAFFQENLEKWSKDPIFKYKYIVIHNKQVVGLYDTSGAALTFAVPSLPSREWIVQQVILEEEIVSYLYPAIA